MSKPTINLLARLRKAFTLRNLWGALLIAITAFNLLNIVAELARTQARRKLSPYIFYGFAFSGIDKLLTGVKAIGYYTDRDLDQNTNAAIFAQAQYMLAPVIVDLNNFDHEFILFDCASEETAMAKIKEIGAVALKKNKLGVILAKHRP